MSHPVLERLASADPAERAAACRAAAEDPAGSLLAGALAGALGDPAKSVVRAASDALVAIHRAAGEGSGVKESVRGALRGEAPAERWGAAFTLARIEPPGPPLLPALVEALGSGDGDVRWAATRLLVETGRLHAQVLHLLVGLVRADEHAIVRRMATYALRELAPDRPEAAYVLLEATADSDLRVRRAAFTAMASLLHPPPEVAERCLAALAEDGDAATRRLAALALGEIGAADRSALPAGAAERLQGAASGGDDADLRRAAARALARLEGAGPRPARRAP